MTTETTLIRFHYCGRLAFALCYVEISDTNCRHQTQTVNGLQTYFQLDIGLNTVWTPQTSREYLGNSFELF